MNKLLFIIFSTIFFYSWNNSREQVRTNTNFENWQKKNKIDSLKLSKVYGKSAFELWAYFDPINKTDSILIWYPNQDSSYFLISNFDNKSGIRIGDSNLIDIDFHERNSKIKKQGISIIDSLSSMSMDVFWIDKETVFLSFKEKEHGKKILMKLKMGIDSLWTNIN